LGSHSREVDNKVIGTAAKGICSGLSSEGIKSNRDAVTGLSASVPFILRKESYRIRITYSKNSIQSNTSMRLKRFSAQFEGIHQRVEAIYIIHLR